MDLATVWKLILMKQFCFAAFIVLVIFRYFRQHVVQQVGDGEAEVGEKEQLQASVVAETGAKEQQQALGMAEKGKKEEEPQQALVVAD